MAPSLVAHYEVYSAGADSSTLTTASFTPSNGEVLVVKLATWDTAHGMNAPTDSLASQTFTAINTAAPGGFNGWCAVYTATVSGSPGAMTISATTDGTNTRHSMVVERWSGAQLAVSPATNATKSGSGSTTATTTLTSTGTNSVVSWCMVDVASRDPASSTYVSTSGTPTQDGLYDGHVGTQSVHYFAYQDAAAAGSQTFGITSAAGNLTWVAVGVEVQAAAAAVTADVSQTVTAASTVTAANAAPGNVSQTATAASTVTAVNAAPAAVSSTITASTTATAAWSGAGGTTDTTTATATVTAIIEGETTTTGSWYQLLDIQRQNADFVRQFRSAPPAACPNDGEPLKTGPDGRLFCPADGWRPDQ